MFINKLDWIEPYVTPQGHDLAGNITGSAFSSCDMTALAVLRALLFRRLDANDSFRLNTWQASPDETPQNADEALRMTFKALGKNELNYVICPESWIDTFNAVATPHAVSKEVDWGFKELADISAWVLKNHHVKCRIFVSSDGTAGWLLVSSANVGLFHEFLTLTPRYIPAFFQNAPLEPYERKMLETLSRRSSADFKLAIRECGILSGFTDEMTFHLVGDFICKSKAKRLRSAEQAMEMAKTAVQSTMRQYAEAIAELQEKTLLVNALMDDADSGDGQSLQDYFRNNKNITVIDAENNRMSIEVRTTMDVFDVGTWKRYADRGSVFERGSKTPAYFEDIEDRKLFLNAIFSDESPIRVKMRGYYWLDLSGTCGTTTGSRIFSCLSKDYITNPHLMYHACLGANHTQISEELVHGRLIGAIECAIASCKSVNLDEYQITIKPMVEELLASTAKCILTEDGQDLTPKEALAWLKKRRNAQ